VLYFNLIFQIIMEIVLSQYQYRPDNERSVKYCPNCGQSAQIEDMFCSSCGTRMDEYETKSTAENKNYDGQPSNGSSDFSHYDTIRNDRADDYDDRAYGADEWITYTKSRKNKWISLLLCIFTVFGHKIYEGKWGMAVVYALTSGLFGIGWVMDIIKIASGPEYYDVD